MSRSYHDAASGNPPPPPQQKARPRNAWQSAGSKVGWNTSKQQQQSVSSNLDPSAANFDPSNRPQSLPPAAPAGVTAAGTKAVKTENPWQSSKAPKKRKPTLKTMSIGDVMPKVLAQPKRAPKPSIPAKRPAPVPKHTKGNDNRKFQSSGVLSNSEFPALSIRRPAAPTAPATTAQATTPGSFRILKAGPLKKAAAPPTKEQPRKAAVSVAVVAAVVAAVPLEDRKVPVSSAADFFAKRQERTGAQEDFAGGEHDLLRLMKQGNMVVQNKGRQRIKPRKKQFSALKKRVLEERLHNWQELHPEEAPNAAAPDGLGTALEAQTCSVCVYGYAELEDLEDDDEYQELVDNLRELASKVGPVQQVFMPRALPDRSVDKYPSFVEFASPQHASAAVTCWHGLVVGGQSLACLALVQAQAEDMDWQDWCLAAETLSTDTTNNVAAVSAEVILESALTEDDLEDEDCLEESVNDIRALAEKYGTVQDIRVEMEPAAHLIIVYAGGLSVARKAAQELGKIVIGGQAVSSRVLGLDAPPQTASSCECSIILRNLLTEDDLEDEDCLEESLNDAKELASKFGTVLGVSLEPDDEARAVKIRFSSTTDGGKSAVDGFDGMVVGGQTVSAVILEGLSTGYVRDTGPSIDSIPDPPTPLFSGDKRIPERFAECKRVPKIPNSGTPRKYATLVDDDSVKPLLIEMLGELMRLQRRAIENNNTKTKRRLVMGLREVARGIRSHKVKMVVMANNLDEYGVIDDKLQEILDLAHEEGVAVFFDLSKRGLGKAIGKTIKIAVVGVQNNDGAHQQFKKLVTLAPKAT